MNKREFTKSGAFVAVVFTLVVVLLPFGLEQIGETTGLFKFPVTKKISSWFKEASFVKSGLASDKPTDWNACLEEGESFAEWMDGCKSIVIKLPDDEPVVIVEEKPARPEPEMWLVPVVSCTASDPVTGRKGYVFISGVRDSFAEGSLITSSEGLCGYEIVFVGERTVWFNVMSGEGVGALSDVKLPEFARVEGSSLVRGKSRYVARDAFALTSGRLLMIDSFMPPDGVVFKILDESGNILATLLCVVIREKGGR